MNRGNRTDLLLGAVLVAEVIGACYVTLVTWLMSGWFVDDAVAATMLQRDWWMLAGQRLAAGAFVAVTFAAALWLLNQWLVRKLAPSHNRLPLISGIVSFVAIFLAAFAGALQFAISKPYM